MGDDSYYSGTSNYRAKQLVRFPASHHTSPLTYYPQRHVRNMLSGSTAIKPVVLLKSYADAVKSVNQKMGGSCTVTDDPTSAYLYFFENSLLDGNDQKLYKEAHKKLKFSIELAIEELTFDLKVLKTTHPALDSIDKLRLTSHVDTELLCRKVSRCAQARELLETIRNRIQKNHMAGDETLQEVYAKDSVRFWVVREMIIFQNRSRSNALVLLNNDQILMLFDTLSCRLMTRISLELNDCLKTDNLPPWSLIKEIYAWGDDMMESYGQHAFSVIGEFESVVTGIFVNFKGSDPLGLGENFLKSVLETAFENQGEWGVPQTFTVDLLNILSKIESVNWLSEIFGLRKHWGNPMVDAKASGTAVQEKVDEVLPVTGSGLIRLHSSFNRMITLEYIKQHGKWPQGSFCPECPDIPLKRAFESNVCRIPETSPGHKHEHWALFKFDCNCLIDSYQDDLNLISDKSVSVYKSHLDVTYVRNLCTVPVPKDIPENRRLILEYLRKKHLSIMDICKIVMSGSIPDEWMANCASMKGTEMKYHKARIFAVLTFELRQYFAATEDMIKECLFRYNPHQTMTLSETDLLTKLREVTRQLDPSTDTRTLSVIHIVDFSKWNLRMRYSNTSSVFKSMDDFLGTPGLIEQTHWVFCNMTNIVQDAFNPPKAGVADSENETIWRNHGCGWEGQRQKGWTILTSALLSDLARVTGVSSTICGQGDNQALLSQFPVPAQFRNPLDWITRDPESVRKILDNYYSTLESECLEIGLKIKTAETCRSLSFFNYGKRLYFNGVELSMTLKRISKDITEPNESYPTAESLLKTLEGSALASSLYSHPSPLPYLISRFAVILQLINCFSKNQLIGETGTRRLKACGMNLTKRFLSYLTKIPASLGGPPQLSLASFIFRGHPDPLCSDLVMLKLRADNGCVVSRRILTLAIDGAWFNKTSAEKESLIMAPFSLNLDVPTSARVPLEQAITPALRNCCNNPRVSDMFSESVDDLDRRLLESLSSMTPFQPLIANDIYSRSPPGRRQAFVSGLANTTSLGRLLYENKERPLIRRIQDLEELQLESWIMRVKDIAMQPVVYDLSMMGHHDIAQKLRNDSWNTEVVGVTVPHPLEQFKLVKADSDICTNFCVSSESEHIVIVRHREEIISLPGVDGLHITSHRSRVGNPYLGSSISEGIIQKQVQCLNPDSTWRDVIRLNTIRKWVCKEGSNLDKLIRELMKLRTDVSEETINGATGEPSRVSYNHRASLQAVIHTCNVGSTTNMHSRLYLSSNRMGEYSHGDFNYHMPFGPVFLCMQELLCWDGVFFPEGWGSEGRVVYHAHVRRKDVPMVFDSAVDLNKQLKMKHQRPRIPKVIFSSSDDLIFDTVVEGAAETFWSKSEDANRRESKYGYCYQLIADGFIKETIIREVITQHHFDGYPSRPAPISIGDVSLVGVQFLLQALAWQFLLLSPTSLWACTDENMFTVRAHGFLSCFSGRFWSSFSLPLSNGRLREKFFGLYPSLIVAEGTRYSSALNPALINAVVIEMVSIKFNLELLIDRTSSYCPYPLFAPSVASLKLYYSKFVELLIYLTLIQSGMSERVSADFGRDFAANVLSSDNSQFSVMVARIKLDVILLYQKLKIPEKNFPDVRFYSLQYSWVDKLRDADNLLYPNLPVLGVSFPKSYPVLDMHIEYVVPKSPILIPLASCHCMITERRSVFHTECYFSQSGLLSKSHLKIMDIVYSLRLDITGVVVLGSSTGTEALSFARHKECSHVYVNCYIPLGQFSQHLAGDYVPSAFSDGRYVEKLVHSSQAVTANSDLMLSRTIEDILAQTDGYPFSGLTCDAEFPESDLTITICNLLNNIARIIQQRNSITWSIIKVYYKCDHDIMRYVSILSVVFSVVRVVRSSFTRPGLSLVYLVGTNRKVVVDMDSLEMLGTHVPSVILENQNLKDFLTSISNSRIPPLFYMPRAELKHRLLVNNTNESSFSRACHSFIPGWGLITVLNPDKDTVKWSLNGMRETITRRITDLLRVNYRAHRQEQMPRNAVLQLDPAPLHKRLNQLFNQVNRTHLLQNLLEQDVFDFEHTVEYLYNWLSLEHTYRMTNRSFKVDISTSFFINKLSRPLFEILGHIYKLDFQIGNKSSEHFLFHRDTTLDRQRLINNLYEPLPVMNFFQTPNLKWQWTRRSDIMAWLLCAALLGEDSTISIIGNRHILEQLHALGHLPNVQNHSDSLLPVNYCSVTSLDELSRLSPHFYSIRFLKAPVKMCRTVGRYFEIVRYYKVPWSGLIPNEVLIEVCFQHRMDLISSQIKFPDFSVLLNSAHDLGHKFVECGCWDCSIEVSLLDTFGIAHSDLDNLCSLKKIESVRDEIHIV